MKRNFGDTFGRTAEGYRQEYEELEKRLKEQPLPPVQDPEQEKSKLQDEPLIMPVNISTDDFIKLEINGLHGNQVYISPYELQGCNNLNYDSTHAKLLNNGLYMPDPHIFMSFFRDIISAYDNKSKHIFTIKGKQLSTQEISDIYKHLTSNHIAIYGKDPGAWTWLNAKFIQDNQKWNLETITGLSNNGLITKQEELEPCLMKDGYIDFTKLNNQGLPNPNAEHNTQKYRQGENIKYLSPENGAVAWFGADSDRAGLGCYWVPLDSGGSLGVFGCAEGA